MFSLGLFTLPVGRVYAVPVADAAASLVVSERQADWRVAKLEAFLSSHGSPMTAQASVFVSEADRLNLDWRLVAAIAGVESTFGKHVPGGSYNGWGWGIPTGARSGVGFENWEHGITTVSEGLKTRYVDRGAVTVEQIGRIYAASPRWAGNVRFFIAKIDAFAPKGARTLAVTL